MLSIDDNEIRYCEFNKGAIYRQPVKRNLNNSFTMQAYENKKPNGKVMIHWVSQNLKFFKLAIFSFLDQSRGLVASYRNPRVLIHGSAKHNFLDKGQNGR